MRLSLQLFSARNFQPYEAVIRRLGALGYQSVEVFGGNFAEADTIRAAADAAGLTIPSAHVPLDLMEGDPDTVAQRCRVLGTERVFVPAIPAAARGKHSADWRALAQRLVRVQDTLAARGIALGWHNHDFEFVTLDDGAIPMEILLAEVPGMAWEADIAWMHRAGVDPLDWIARHGKRIVAAHFKDRAPEGEKTDEDGWADPGTGVLEWPGIHAALRRDSACEMLVAEHDNPADFDRFARQAVAFYRTLQ